MIEQRVTLRYDAQQIPAIVQAVQGDTGRDVIFELADYEIPAGATANYYIDKPDGNAVYNSAEVISSTEILAHLTEQALAVPGRNNGQVRILSDGEVITSFDFVLEVEVFRGLMRMQSETEVNIFDDALQAAAEEAIQEILDQTPVVTGMQNSIAPSYSNSQTYNVGDYVMYNAQLYKCNTAVTTAEAWTEAHWTHVPLANDVNDLNGALRKLKNNNNLFENPASFIHNAYYDTAIHTTTNKDVYVLSLIANTEYSFRGVRFISSEGTLLENIQSSQYLHTFTPSVSGNYYITIDTTDEIHFFVTTEIYNSGLYGTNEEPVLAERLVLQSIGNSKTSTMSQKAIADGIENAIAPVSASIAEKFVNVNLADPSMFTENHYVGNDGSVGSSSDYFFTDYIYVGDSEEISFTNARFLTAYNSQKTVMPNDGINSQSTTASNYTVPDGVYYVIITGETTNINKFMVNVGSFVHNFTPYAIKDLADNIFTKTKANIGHSLSGASEIINTSSLQNTGSDLYINKSPQNLKNGVILSAYCEFDSFTSVVIGKGYNSYRGDWFDIDDTNVVMKHYEQSQQTISTQAHNIVISDYIQVYADFRSNGKVIVTINSTGGTSKLEFDHTFEQNGIPFIFGRQEIRNIKFNAVSSKAKCPLWIIGDSYLGFSEDRVMGQLHALGHTDNILIDGLAGQGSVNAYRELLYLIGGGNIPKYLIWYIGMNDTDAVYEEYLEKVASVCATYGITLIINDVPTVPLVDNETKHSLVSTYKVNGYRTVDSYSAVGATSDGAWRTGYLSSDNVHPTALGAKALSVALLNSVPEIGQY